MIFGFQGKYRFLSNFYPAPIRIRGVRYPTSEHAFQAQKTQSTNLRILISRCKTPGEAKQAGRQVALDPNWDSIKQKRMLQILRVKFQDPILRQKLIKTLPHKLVEANRWGDKYWGTDMRGNGKNKLGKLLQKVRLECLEEETSK
jgi:ribA/ribD-fused uncharacterized protein